MLSTPSPLASQAASAANAATSARPANADGEETETHEKLRGTLLQIMGRQESQSWCISTAVERGYDCRGGMPCIREQNIPLEACNECSSVSNISHASFVESVLKPSICYCRAKIDGNAQAVSALFSGSSKRVETALHAFAIPFSHLRDFTMFGALFDDESVTSF